MHLLYNYIHSYTSGYERNDLTKVLAAGRSPENYYKLYDISQVMQNFVTFFKEKVGRNTKKIYARK